MIRFVVVMLIVAGLLLAVGATIVEFSKPEVDTLFVSFLGLALVLIGAVMSPLGRNN